MSSEKIFFLEIKDKIHYINESIGKLFQIKEEVSTLIKQNNLDIKVDLNNLLNEIRDNTEIIKQLNKSECDHNIIDDYIETGLEGCMQKIKYCDICFTTF
ncbi:hypothetical protein N8996_06540 [Candidatus Poseidonia alphae]|nr:hypothetical protein [Candidatus Poseidonia alphae]